MKTIIVCSQFLVLVLLLSCKKSDSIGNGAYCWHCTFGVQSNGVTPPPKDTCWNHDYAPQWRDQYGNDLSSICQLR